MGTPLGRRQQKREANVRHPNYHGLGCVQIRHRPPVPINRLRGTRPFAQQEERGTSHVHTVVDERNDELPAARGEQSHKVDGRQAEGGQVLVQPSLVAGSEVGVGQWVLNNLIHVDSGREQHDVDPSAKETGRTYD